MARTKNSIIIFGGSRSKIPFIKVAQQQNYRTVVFDNDPECPGAVLADCYYQVSLRSFTQLFSRINFEKQQSKVCGILCYISNADTIRVAARLANNFSFNCFSINSAELSTNKIAMKQVFECYEIRIPKWTQITTFNQADHFVRINDYPVILKPAQDTCGSLGVQKIHNEKDLKDYFLKMGDEDVGTFLIEQCICGIEYSVDGISQNGHVHIFSIAIKHGQENENCIISGFSMLSKKEDVVIYQLLEKLAVKAVLAMQIDGSCFSVDIIVDQGDSYVLECGVLLDCKIDRLLKHSGIDIYKAILDLALSHPIHVQTNEVLSAIVFIYSKMRGRLFIPDKLVSEPLLEWERMANDLVCPAHSTADMVGWALASGGDSRVALQNAQSLADYAASNLVVKECTSY